MKVRRSPGSSGSNETSAEFLARIGETLLGQAPTDATLRAILTQLDLPPEQLAALGVPRRAFGRSRDAQARIAAGWMLSSAEFQRR